MMTGRYFNPLRTLQARFLLALALIGVLPLGLVGLGIATLDRRALAEQSAQELTGLARGLAGQLEVYLDGLFSATRAIAALPEIVSLDPARQESLLKEIFHHYTQFARLSTFDLVGLRLASSHPGGVPSIAVRQSFHTASQRGHQAWEVAAALSSGRSSLLIHTPIRDAERRVVGVVGAVIDLENLSAVVGGVPVGGGGRVLVLDAAQHVLMHPERAVVQERRDYSWMAVATGGRLASPATARYQMGDEALVAGYAPVPTTNWTVVAERPEQVILAPAQRSWRLALLGLAVSAGCALLTAVLLARTLTRPVRELAVAARAFGAGDSTAALPAVVQGDGELRTLIDAFATMRESVMKREEGLRQLATELEAHIAERQRAEAHVLQQLARLALLHQITRAIGERQELDSIFLVVLQHLEQELPLALACLCLGALGSDTVTVTAVGPASQALAPTVGLEERVVLSLDQMGLRACADEQTVSVFDTAQETLPRLQRLAQAGLQSLIAIPLLVEDNIFGLLLAVRREPQGFSSGEGEFLRQLSEHIALAAHHASLYAKLRQAYNDLHQSQQVIMQQERLRALGQMASGIAHDINNAISPITLYVESLLASDATLSARARDYLSTVQQAANDVAHTVARLREFYRQPVGLQEAQPVDLNQIVPQVVELTRAKWRDEPQRLGVTITVHTALQQDGLPRILGVESELREALINLIFNAVDAMPRGGDLTIQTRATPTAVIVEVSDTGIGMDETTRQRCLEPFYTTKDARGTGLGLAMVYGVTERHAAQLMIESAVGQGTTMRLLFPVALSQSALHDQPADVEAGPHSLRLLVVDDDPLLRRLLQDVLQTEGHVVTVVEAGRVALEALRVARERQEPFDVVITDLGMPEMDGREVARGVKQAAPHTPVILLTGWGQALRQEEALPPHVDHLLSKPPGLRELRAALRAVARPAGRQEH